MIPTAAPEAKPTRRWSDRQAILKHIQPEEWTAIIAGAREAAAKDAQKNAKGR